MSSETPVIELAKAEKRYGDRWALKPTDLAFGHGQTVALIGPSGCGKSTLLRLTIGLIEPSSGSVRFEGQAVTRASSTGIRRKTGYVIQDGGLFPHLTAEQNAGLLARHLRRPEGEIAARVKELCDLVKLPSDALSRYPGELSGGQRQRVSLMRALMLDPDVLLLDEPLAALDPLVRHGLQKDLKDLFDRLHKTVVLVTHDMAEAAYLAERIVLMRDGSVLQDGSLDDFRDRPVEPFVTEFLNAQRSLVAL